MIYQPWIVDPSYLRGEQLAEAQAKNREYAKKKVEEAIAAEKKALEDRITWLMGLSHGQIKCDFCTGLPSGGEHLKYDCDRLYGLVIEDDVVSCPKCKRCLATWHG